MTWLLDKQGRVCRVVATEPEHEVVLVDVYEDPTPEPQDWPHALPLLLDDVVLAWWA